MAFKQEIHLFLKKEWRDQREVDELEPIGLEHKHTGLKFENLKLNVVPLFMNVEQDQEFKEIILN